MSVHNDQANYARIILWMRPTNGTRCYIVTPSLIDWVHTQNDPWLCHANKFIMKAMIILMWCIENLKLIYLSMITIIPVVPITKKFLLKILITFFIFLPDFWQLCCQSIRNLIARFLQTNKDFDMKNFSFSEVGFTKAPFVNFSIREIFYLIKVLIKLLESHSHLTV